MKISRSADHLSFTLTMEEMADVIRNLGHAGNLEVRCWARYIPSDDTIEVYFGQGRKFRYAKGDYWTVALDVDACGAQQLEKFGMTPTTYVWRPGRKLAVRVPDLKMQLRRNKAVIEKPRAFIPATRQPPGLKPVLPQPEPVRRYEYQRDVTDGDLKSALEIFNRAIERGYAPQFDGRGRILFFDRRVGG